MSVSRLVEGMVSENEVDGAKKEPLEEDKLWGCGMEDASDIKVIFEENKLKLLCCETCLVPGG